MAPPPQSDHPLDTLLKSKELNGLMVLLTFFALIGDDLRLAYYTIQEDPIFFALSTFAMIMFIAEIGLNWMFRIEYR